MVLLSLLENRSYGRSYLKISLKYRCLNGSVWDKLSWPCVLTEKQKDPILLTVPSLLPGLVHDFSKSYLGIIYDGRPDTLPIHMHPEASCFLGTRPREARFYQNTQFSLFSSLLLVLEENW